MLSDYLDYDVLRDLRNKMYEEVKYIIETYHKEKKIDLMYFGRRWSI